jgi:hypothetical protein
MIDTLAWGVAIRRESSRYSMMPANNITNQNATASMNARVRYRRGAENAAP